MKNNDFYDQICKLGSRFGEKGYSGPNKLFSNGLCKIQSCHIWFKVRVDFKKGRIDVKKQSEMLKKKDYKRSKKI